MTREKEPISQERYPYFAVVGGVGVGKSKLTGLLQSDFGLPLFEEQYVDNPYLGPFCREDPHKHAFNSQTFFLIEEVRQMCSLAARLTKEPVGHDQHIEGDAFFESILWREMGFISDEEHAAYRSVFAKLTGDNFLPKPDIYIGIMAKEETAVTRIMERGREMELSMHERYPSYFPTIVRCFNSWLNTLSQQHPVIIVDTDRWDFVKSDLAKEKVLDWVRDWSGYYLSSPSQLNLRGNDGAHLILPDFVRTRPSYTREQKALQRI